MASTATLSRFVCFFPCSNELRDECDAGSAMDRSCDPSLATVCQITHVLACLLHSSCSCICISFLLCCFDRPPRVLHAHQRAASGLLCCMSGHMGWCQSCNRSRYAEKRYNSMLPYLEVIDIALAGLGREARVAGTPQAAADHNISAIRGQGRRGLGLCRLSTCCRRLPRHCRQ